MDEHRSPFYITTAIPFVNAPPHVGFAMELVLADVLARYHRSRGRAVRFLTGTDENSLKNVHAAAAEGISTRTLVERNAAAFRALQLTLGLSFDDFIRTSADPRHRPGVEKLWRACAARGDIYRRTYRGLYCVGCEQFYGEGELLSGKCPEHGTRPEQVEEENYFFRLSRHQRAIQKLLRSGELRVVPESFQNELLALVNRGLEDFSVSRSSRRARGWGIPVPDDPDQVMYVWFDALGNYITALDYSHEGPLYGEYWAQPGERVHVIGKGITRFHAIYWPAILLSAGLALPSAIFVHGYLTVDGRKIGKSLGNAIAPEDIVAEFGVDAVRYYLCRHVRAGLDGDFSRDRLARVRDTDLADQLGNLLRRITGMIERYSSGIVPHPRPAQLSSRFADQAARVRNEVMTALDAFRLHDALAAIWSLVDTGNRYVVEQAPWELARHRTDQDVDARLRTVLYELAELLRLIAHHLAPFLPRTAAEICRQLGLDASRASWEADASWGRLRPGARVVSGPVLFPKPP